MSAPFPIPCGIIADDLTGGCDAGAAFAQCGVSTVVWLRPEALDAAAAKVHVLVSGSRAAPDAKAAAARVRELGQLLAAHGLPLVFLKIDSLLRGYPRADLEATGAARALISPAFPANGRIVENGTLRVVSDPSFEPIALADVFGPGAAIRDARSGEDLAAIVREAYASAPPALLAGSAGLAWQLARSAGLPRDVPPPPRRKGRLLAVVGSVTALTLQQLARLEAERPPNLDLLRFDWSAAAYADLRERAAAWNIADISALILSGGDMAAAAAGLLHASGIRLKGEIQPGIPWGRWVGGRLHHAPVATKSGGFGSEDAYLEICRFLGG